MSPAVALALALTFAPADKPTVDPFHSPAKPTCGCGGPESCVCASGDCACPACEPQVLGEDNKWRPLSAYKGDPNYERAKRAAWSPERVRAYQHPAGAVEHRSANPAASVIRDYRARGAGGCSSG